MPLLRNSLPPPIQAGQPLTALAPMQDVTDLPFMRLLGKYGPPDYFFTEYFRVHEHSTLEEHILASVLEHNTGRPVFAQLIGENIHHLVRTAKELAKYPIAGIDLNMGCPAPKVYRKNVGGGLLREPDTIERIFAALKDASSPRFTVKMRIGFDSYEHFDRILALVEKYQIDNLSIHGRTVKQMYRGLVDYDMIRHAVQRVSCPVFANGNITHPEKAIEVVESTQCAGVMIGRSAIRNPWLFRQVQEAFAGKEIYQPTLAQVRIYIDDLWQSTTRPGLPEHNHINRMKKFLAFLGQAIDEDGAFLYKVRRAMNAKAFFSICDEFLVHNGNADKPFRGYPFEGVVARPNHEDEISCSA